MTEDAPPVVLIGYSGHAYVVLEALQSMGRQVVGYCEESQKSINPFHLEYWGSENCESVLQRLKEHDYFVCIGDNKLRERIQTTLTKLLGPPINVVAQTASVSPSAKLGFGVLVGPNTRINALADIGNGAICNTSSVIEHECQVGAFSHIGPGTILTGTVSVGRKAFIGAGAVVIPGLQIGEGAIVGAGTVVHRSIPNDVTAVGNPCRLVSSGHLEK